MRCGGKALESFEAIGTFKDTLGNGWVEVFVDGMYNGLLYFHSIKVFLVLRSFSTKNSDFW